MNYSDITKIVAYKIDLGMWDEIGMDIHHLDGTINVISEEEDYYKDVLNKLHLLNGFDGNWFSKVSQPAFKTCETVFYDRC
jgi:hypothetical protein